MNNKMYVYIAISDLTVHPDVITRILGVEPTKIDIKGDTVGKSKIKCKSNRWEYRVDASERFELEYLIKKLIRQFKDVRALKRAIGKGKGHINCVFKSNDRTPTIEMSPEVLSWIAELKCSFWLDYYT